MTLNAKILTQAQPKISSNVTHELFRSINEGVNPEEPPRTEIDAIINLYRKRKSHFALKECSKLSERFPNSAVLHNIHGSILKQMGYLEAAIKNYKAAILINPNYADAYNNLGNAFEKQGKFLNALQSFKKALNIKPNYSEAYNNMGITFERLKKIEAAVNAYKMAVYFNPKYEEAFYNLGNVFRVNNQPDSAMKAYNKAISLKPDYVEAHNNLGITLKEQGKIGEALAAYKKAISLNFNYANAHNNMGNLLAEQGNPIKAIEAFNRAVALDPYLADAHRGLSNIKNYEKKDPHIAEVQKLLKEKNLQDEVKCKLSFVLFKMYNDLGETENAFEILNKANNLRKKLLNYSFAQDQNLFEKLKVMQPELAKSRLTLDKKPGLLSPIFIIGMPRSGTTLVEQIISSHSKVTGAGELPYIWKFGEPLATGKRDLNKKAISEFRESYLLELSKFSDNKSIITDKMPHNFRFVPLILAAFPEAKIVHVKRDPKATCWSNFKTYFTSSSLGYCYDLDDLTSYYRHYCDLMNYWKSKYEDKIFELDYDLLTMDKENEIKKILKYLNLEFEFRCLTPEKNHRPIRTASQHQVRKAIYKGSSKDWKKYQSFLNKAFQKL